MTNKFAAYRFVAPVRSRLQRRLMEDRKEFGPADFERQLHDGSIRKEIAPLMWRILRENAFVPDFRPDVNDDLSDVYGMGPEEIRDDLVDPIVTSLGIEVSQLDFTGFDFASLRTPRDVSDLISRLAKAEPGTRMQTAQQ